MQSADRREKKLVSNVMQQTDVALLRLNGMLSYLIHSFDRPAWLKVATLDDNGDTVFRMLEMNELYSEVFGIPRKRYINKTDLEAGWDQKTSAAFRAHDLLVWASGEPQTIVETINGVPQRFRKNQS